MKIAIVLPANILHSPYINYYVSILEENNIEYEIIYWNKLKLNEEFKSSNSFNLGCDYKSNLISKSIGYLLFANYAKRLIKKNRYDKIIIFIPQFAIFLRRYLNQFFKGEYILDIRDYGRSNLYNKQLKQLIKNAGLTVISSMGYRNWLPVNAEYVISHNVNFEKTCTFDMKNQIDLKLLDNITISNIGVIRNFKINKLVIDKIKGSTRFNLLFIGKGIVEKDLQEYCNEIKCNNVSFYGRYEKEQEIGFYKKSDIINLIMPTNEMGYKTLLPNRLYNACISGRPVIVSKGTFLEEIVLKYNLGTSIDIDDDELINVLENYISKFESDVFYEGCRNFLSDVEKDQVIFKRKVKEFLINT